MTSPLEDLIRDTLTDLAEEAPTVQDQLPPAERRARTEIGQGRDALLVTQQRLRRHDDQRLAE